MQLPRFVLVKRTGGAGGLSSSLDILISSNIYLMCYNVFPASGKVLSFSMFLSLSPDDRIEIDFLFQTKHRCWPKVNTNCISPSEISWTKHISPLVSGNRRFIVYYLNIKPYSIHSFIHSPYNSIGLCVFDFFIR